MLSPLRRVTLLVAMDIEARPILRVLELSPAAAPDPRLPMQRHTGRHGGLDVSLLLFGRDPDTGVDCIGTQAATLAAYLAVRPPAPDLLINIGTAGGFRSRGAAVGDLYLVAGEFVYHDRRIPLGPFEAYGWGRYPAREVSALAAALGWKTGVLSTGNSLDATERDLAIMAEHRAALKDMEGAAVAWVARRAGVPLLALKAVTDLVDHPAPVAEQFEANHRQVTYRMAEATARLLDRLAQESV